MEAKGCAGWSEKDVAVERGEGGGKLVRGRGSKKRWTARG